jgi:hypothetical protein
VVHAHAMQTTKAYLLYRAASQRQPAEEPIRMHFCDTAKQSILFTPMLDASSRETGSRAQFVEGLLYHIPPSTFLIVEI